MMHSKHLILHDEVGWVWNASQHYTKQVILTLLFQKLDKTIYILSQISCYPCGAKILRTKVISSKRMRNVFWSSLRSWVPEETFWKPCRWGCPFLRCENGKLSEFWVSYLDLVDILLAMIRTSREGDWDLHLTSIRNLIPWCFALNNINYARYFFCR